MFVYNTICVFQHLIVQRGWCIKNVVRYASSHVKILMQRVKEGVLKDAFVLMGKY